MTVEQPMQLYINGPSHCVAKPHNTAPPRPTEAQSQIDHWLNTGKRFFPRETIRAIHDQLRVPLSKGDKILVKALDGAVIAFEVRTGHTREIGRQPETIGKPFIRYISYESLRAGRGGGIERPHLVYCTMIIQHAATTGPPPNIPRRSINDIHHTLSTARHIWEESAVWAQIKTTFLSARAPTNITKIIGFACGTMSYPDEVPGSSYNSIFQHAFLVSIQHLLQDKSRSNEQIPCSVQDPAYADGDRAVLPAWGINVLDDPQGFLEINDDTLVFSSAPDIPVKQIVVDVARPAVIIWDRVEDGASGGTDPDSPRVRQVMARFYQALEFPIEEHFGDMVIYVRKWDIG
ncbi:hypothetical protein BJX63DRAFT_403231 [Aspergillus granulosus]|uniref:SRR1-like domain-containing protein n=1 Tax=Aspergillus granulosus TaxID=176169 RepID=A0ABR4H3G3_9EURO